MDTFHELIDAVDDIKCNITDKKYKHLVETIGQLKKKTSRFVKINYVKLSIKFDDDEDTWLPETCKSKIFQITDEKPKGSKCTCCCYEARLHLTEEQLDDWKKNIIRRIHNLQVWVLKSCEDL